MMVLVARLALGLLAIGAVAAGVVGTRPDVPAPETSRVGRVAVAPVQDMGGKRLLEISRGTTPFRADRRPPAERYGAVVVAGTPAAPPTPKPVLILSGILWGPEPSAILEGIPAQEGPVVVRQGQAIGPLTVIAIDSMRVVVRGLDTTWTLRVRQPWQ